MTIQTALAKLRRRNMNFATLRGALAHYSLPTSNGWGRLEKKYAELELPAMDTAVYASKLEKIYRDNIEWGNKAVQFCVFDDTVGNLLSDAVAHRFVPEFTPASPFPLYVTDAELENLTLHPVLVASAGNESRTGVTLYFYSRAYEVEKETFTVDDMKDDVSVRRFAGFDHVIAYRQLIFQRIDSVYIDSRSRRIEFRADVTRLKTTDRMLEALKELKACFRALMENQISTDWDTVEFQLTNFFPKIDQLYHDGKGELVELGHNTAAGAINHGKMRGHRGDLKLDPSHVASMAASTTEKFAIQKAYSYYSGNSIVYLRIPGKSADTGMETAVVNTAIVEDCIDKIQFEEMMQILR